MTESLRTGSARGKRYSEHLTTPWWWWIAGAVLAALLGVEIQMAGYYEPWTWAAYPVLAGLIGWGIWSMGRAEVSVGDDGSLRAHKAVLPRDVIARGAVIAPSAKSAAMGRQLDPAAFLMHRSWIKSMLLLVLDDPDDPTPYWLISTRHPEQVLEALKMTDAAQE